MDKLKFVNGFERKTEEEGVTVIKTRSNKSMKQLLVQAHRLLQRTPSWASSPRNKTSAESQERGGVSDL